MQKAISIANAVMIETVYPTPIDFDLMGTRGSGRNTMNLASDQVLSGSRTFFLISQGGLEYHCKYAG